MLSRSTITASLLLNRGIFTSLKHPTLPIAIPLNNLPVLSEAALVAIPSQQAWATEVSIDYQQKQLCVNYNSKPQPLPNIREVIERLRLEDIYGDLLTIDEIKDKRFLGFHGLSINSADIVMPIIDPQKFGNQGTHHSHPNPENNSFHIANNLRAALHYAKLNGLSHSTYLNPTHYDPSLVVMCCADPLQAEEGYHHNSLTAWHYEKNRQQNLGQECLIPKSQYAGLLNLGLFQIQGRKRLFPLQEGQIIYHEEKPYIWSQGKLKEVEDNSEQNRLSS